MCRLQTCVLSALLLSISVTYHIDAQEQSDSSVTAESHAPTRDPRHAVRRVVDEGAGD